MKQITLEYFALLRDEAGFADEQIETEAGNPAALYNELAKRHGFSLPPSRLRVAINTAFASWNSPLSSGDHVVFIPPVSGG